MRWGGGGGGGGRATIGNSGKIASVRNEFAYFFNLRVLDRVWAGWSQSKLIEASLGWFGLVGLGWAGGVCLSTCANVSGVCASPYV